MKCEICKCNFGKLASHLNRWDAHNITLKKYYDTYLKEENVGLCLECGKKTKFVNLRIGYHKTCSMRCHDSYFSKIRVGVKCSKEHVERMRKAIIGRVFSKKHKENLRKAQTGKRHSEFTRLKIKRLTSGKNNGMYGRTHTNSAKEKLSAALTKRILSGEHKTIGFKSGNKGYFYSHKNKINIRYDSGLEFDFYKVLEMLPNITAYKRCDFSIPYKVGNVSHRYIPDIIVSHFCYPDEVVEIKPKNFVKDIVNVLKAKAARRYLKKTGLSYSVYTDKYLVKLKEGLNVRC